MRVAINGWFWDREETGSGQYLRHLVKYLPKVDKSVEVLLIVPPHNPRPQDVPDGVQVISTGDAPRTSALGKIWFEQRTVPQAAGRAKADVLHVPYWGSPLNAPVPIVVSVQDVIPLLYPDYARGIKNRLYYALVSTSARAANHVITMSISSQIDVERMLNIPRERITVTYHAPEARFHPLMGAENDEAVRAKYNLPDKFVLYLGGFDVRKRVGDLLLAYTWIREAQEAALPLVIAGREPAWGTPVFPDLRKLADELGVADWVQWIGFVDEADKPSLYRLAEVFVFPSEYEGFGMPPLEAMACGTPVVARNTDVNDELYEDAVYLVDDARSMAGAIIALILQKPFRDALVNQGLARATHFTWYKHAKKALSAYHKALAR